MANYNDHKIYTNEDGETVIAHRKHYKVGTEGPGTDYVEVKKIVLSEDGAKIDDKNILCEGDIPVAENVPECEATDAAGAVESINAIRDALIAAGIMEADPVEPTE